MVGSEEPARFAAAALARSSRTSSESLSDGRLRHAARDASLTGNAPVGWPDGEVNSRAKTLGAAGLGATEVGLMASPNIISRLPVGSVQRVQGSSDVGHLGFCLIEVFPFP